MVGGGTMYKHVSITHSVAHCGVQEENSEGAQVSRRRGCQRHYCMLYLSLRLTMLNSCQRRSRRKCKKLIPLIMSPRTYLAQLSRILIHSESAIYEMKLYGVDWCRSHQYVPCLYHFAC